MTDNVNLSEKLKHYFGFDSFKGDQEAIIRSLMAGHNVFVLMPTGGGKSLCYQLPSLLMEGTAIVVSPLIALMKNQVDAVNGISEHNGLAHYLNSSLTKAQTTQVMNDVRNGQTKLLYVAPESLNKPENLEFSSRSRFRSMPSMKPTASRSGDTTSAPSTATSDPPSTRLATRR